MSYKFNPFTGDFDVDAAGSPVFNVYYILQDDFIVICDGEENFVTSSQTVDGVLVVDGRNTIL